MIPPRRRAGLVALGAGLLGLAVGCGGDDGNDGEEPSDTLGSLSSGDVAPASTATPAGTDAIILGTSGNATAPTDETGAGVVSLQVRIAATGVDELIELDRGAVDAASLDPISLDATCTALDGGEGLTVAVTDMRRVSAGSRLVSAVLRVDGEVAAGGEYEGTIDVGDNQQVVTTYAGLVTLGPGLATGTFDMIDGSGRAATGSFTCNEDAIAPTTTTIPTTTIPIATS